jgi:hypothetical protein
MYSSDGLSGASAIRFPSTANLAIDSFDRSGVDGVNGVNGANFTIQKRNNILSGFFTRMGVNEVVLDYALPNISPIHDNTIFEVVVGSTPVNIPVPEGNYTVSSLMAFLVAALNTAATGVTFSFAGPSGGKALVGTGAFTVNPTVLSGYLSMTPGDVPVPSVNNAVPVLFPELLAVTYFDFLCSNLTYQQGLKDADTSRTSKDVLYRWILSWDDYNPEDPDGYPIYQGYMPFKSRRYLSFPKQIKWDGQQPIGQLTFQVYGSDGELAKTSQRGVFEWYMNLLISEQ